MLNLIYLQILLVLIIDISGFSDTLTNWISKYLKVSPDNLDLRPFTCSLCMQTWIGLFYLLFSGQFSLSLFTFNMILAFLTPVTMEMLLTIKDLLIRIIYILKTFFQI